MDNREYTGPDRYIKIRDKIFIQDFKLYPKCLRQFKLYEQIVRRLNARQSRPSNNQ